MATLTRITPCLWFDDRGEEAARFYTGIFDNSRIVHIAHYGSAGPRPPGMVMTVIFELAGQEFMALNGGPEFTFDEAISFTVNCESQQEVDYFWSKLGDGGEEGQCGWLRDRFGVSWQVVPTVMEKIMRTAEPEKAQQAMRAMLGMKKLDVAALKAAAEEPPVG